MKLFGLVKCLIGVSLWIECRGSNLNAGDDCRIQNSEKTELLLNKPYDCPTGYGCVPKISSGFVLNSFWSCQKGSDELIIDIGDICRYEEQNYSCPIKKDIQSQCGDTNLCEYPLLSVGSLCVVNHQPYCEDDLICQQQLLSTLFTCTEPPKDISVGSDCSIGSCTELAVCVNSICQKSYLEEGDSCEAVPLIPPEGYIHFECKEGLECRGNMIMGNTCTSIPVKDCDEKTFGNFLTEVLYCNAQKQCPDGMECSGCKATKCECDSFSGEVICNDVCRPFCKSLDSSASTSRIGINQNYDCSSPINDWSFDHQNYCCTRHWIGCNTEPYDCTVPVKNITINYNWQSHTKDRQQISTDVTYTSGWDAERKNFCCTAYGIACFVYPTCEWAVSSSLWTPAHRKWCCSHHGIQCEVQTPEIIKERSEYELLCSGDVSSWSLSRNGSCCLGIGVACLPNKYDCSRPTTDLSQEAKKWCCTHNNQHCMYKCTLHESKSRSHREYCCRLRGSFCDMSGDFTTHLPDFPLNGTDEGNVSVSRPWAFHRVKLRFDYWNVAASPRMKFSQLRMTIIKMSPRLRDRPHTVHITAVGGLLFANHVPEDLRDWGIKFPEKWNAEDCANSTDLHIIRNISVMEEEAVSIWKPGVYPSISKGANGIFIDFIVHTHTAATEESLRWLNNVHNELQKSINSGQHMKGSFSDNWFGYSLFTYPISHTRLLRGSVAEEIAVSSTPSTGTVIVENKNSISTAGLIVVIGCAVLLLFSLCGGYYLCKESTYSDEDVEMADPNEGIDLNYIPGDDNETRVDSENSVELVSTQLCDDDEVVAEEAAV